MDVEKLSEFIGMAEKNESMSIENQSSVAQISEEEQHWVAIPFVTMERRRIWCYLSNIVFLIIAITVYELK